MSEILFKDESYRIIGACFEVYKQKGIGFIEPVYQECLAIEFGIQEIPFVAQPRVYLEYKGTQLKQYFSPDFICFDRIIVEVKSVTNLIDEHRAQTFNYLCATRFELALLVNFGHYPKVEYQRFVKSRDTSNIEDEMRSWLK